MILHTINKISAFEKCRQLIAAEDQVLLLEDGVYLALSGDLPCCAIAADVEARGLTERVAEGTRLISYPDFVDLTIRAEKVCAWF